MRSTTGRGRRLPGSLEQQPFFFKAGLRVNGNRFSIQPSGCRGIRTRSDPRPEETTLERPGRHRPRAPRREGSRTSECWFPGESARVAARTARRQNARRRSRRSTAARMVRGSPRSARTAERPERERDPRAGGRCAVVHQPQRVAALREQMARQKAPEVACRAGDQNRRAWFHDAGHAGVSGTMKAPRGPLALAPCPRFAVSVGGRLLPQALGPSTARPPRSAP